MNPRIWGWFDGFKSVAFWGWTDSAVVPGGFAPGTVERVVSNKGVWAEFLPLALKGAAFPTVSQAGTSTRATVTRAAGKAAATILTSKAEPGTDPCRAAHHNGPWVSVTARFTPSVGTSGRPGLIARSYRPGKSVKK
ncbi:MAG: hypothetical protein ACE5EI_06390 [Thermodesulfobacteriota bacterium]